MGRMSLRSCWTPAHDVGLYHLVCAEIAPRILAAAARKRNNIGSVVIHTQQLDRRSIVRKPIGYELRESIVERGHALAPVVREKGFDAGSTRRLAQTPFPFLASFEFGFENPTPENRTALPTSDRNDHWFRRHVGDGLFHGSPRRFHFWRKGRLFAGSGRRCFAFPWRTAAAPLFIGFFQSDRQGVVFFDKARQHLAHKGDGRRSFLGGRAPRTAIAKHRVGGAHRRFVVVRRIVLARRENTRIQEGSVSV